MTWIEGILISAAGSLLAGFIGWLLRTWLIPDPKIAQTPSDESPSLSEVVDFYVRQQQAGIVLRQKTWSLNGE